MGFTVTPVDDFPSYKSWDVTATLDADALEQFAHGFVDGQGNNVEPLIVFTSKQLNLPTVWGATANLINIDAIKDTGVGTGNAAVQVRVYALLPHSVMR